MATAGLFAFSVTVHAQPQDCGLLCTPGFWKQTDVNSVMEVILSGHEVVKVLIDSGADIDTRAGFDFAFLRAPVVHNKNLDKFESGELWGANSPETETTLLHWAAGINDNPDVILALLDADSNLEARYDFLAPPPPCTMRCSTTNTMKCS